MTFNQLQKAYEVLQNFNQWKQYLSLPKLPNRTSNKMESSSIVSQNTSAIVYNSCNSELN